MAAQAPNRELGLHAHAHAHVHVHVHAHVTCRIRRAGSGLRAGTCPGSATSSTSLPLTVKELRVANKGWELVELSDTEQAAAEETLAIRGYRLLKHETRTIHVKAGEHLVYENDKARAPRRPRRAPATRTRVTHAPGPVHTPPGPCSVLTSVLPCSCRCDLWTRTQGGASRLWRSRRGQPPPTG